MPPLPISDPSISPVDALDEIAFWMERALGPEFKVKAFRGAARAIGGWSTDEVRNRTEDGRLKRTKGVGGRSLEVVQQALAGGIPDYLADLRAKDGAPLETDGADIRAQLKGDLHTHSEWSDGTVPIELMVGTAARLGHEYIALTDHSPNLTIANGLTAERLSEQLSVIERINADPPRDADGRGIRLLSGIEVDILEDGTLDQTPQMLDRLDIVTASVHSKLRTPKREMTERMLGGIRNPRTTVLGHCTGRLVQGNRGTRPPSEFDAEAVFAACAEHGVAVEINSRPERQDPPDELIAQALDAGCLFSIDTDAHAPGHLDFLDYGAARAVRNGVPADRIITTWPVERLLEWVRANRG